MSDHPGEPRRPLRPLAPILRARERGENPDLIERENRRLRRDAMNAATPVIDRYIRPRILGRDWCGAPLDPATQKVKS